MEGHAPYFTTKEQNDKHNLQVMQRNLINEKPCVDSYLDHNARDCYGIVLRAIQRKLNKLEEFV